MTKKLQTSANSKKLNDVLAQIEKTDAGRFEYLSLCCRVLPARLSVSPFEPYQVIDSHNPYILCLCTLLLVVCHLYSPRSPLPLSHFMLDPSSFMFMCVYCTAASASCRRMLSHSLHSSLCQELRSKCTNVCREEWCFLAKKTH